MVQFFLFLWFTAAGFGVIFEYTIWHNVVDYNHSIALLRGPFCDEISFGLFWAYFFYTLKTEFNFLMEIVPVNIKENVTFIKKAIQPMKWKWFFSEGSDIDLIDLNIGTIKPKPKKALYMTFFRIKICETSRIYRPDLPGKWSILTYFPELLLLNWF